MCGIIGIASNKPVSSTIINSLRKLEYRGRLDDNWQQPHEVTHEDLKMAIEAVLDSNEIEFDQIPSMGCNIKWK